VLTSGSANLVIRIDDGLVMNKPVAFTGSGIELDAVTVTQAIAALTTAAFTGITWSLDAKTQRLKGVATGTGKIIQVVGPLAAAMDFGQGIKHGGNGLEVISWFDDETVSIGLPKDIKDREEIDIEGAKGTLTRMIIPAMLQGMSPVFTTKEKDYYFLELVQGGNLNRTTWAYNPPLSAESDSPSFWGEIFSPTYSRGSSKMSDVANYERILLRTMVGIEGDVPIEAKAWATYAYNLTATEYTDENDKQWPAWEEQPLTLAAFDALKVKDIKILEAA